MQRGSLKQFYNKRRRVKVWRFQWREPGFKGPRTRELGRCSEMSRAEARNLADRILAQVQNFSADVRRDSVMTLKAFVYDTYLEVKNRKWKASTRDTTEQIIRDHIVRSIGDDTLHEISRRQLQALLDHLATDGLSESVVKHVRFQLQAIFAMALGDGLIKVDPTSGLQTPLCKAAGEKRVLATCDVSRAQLCLEIRERLMLMLAVFDGLRPGEIVGLQVADIAEDGICTISRRIYRRRLDTPKSKRSKRVVPLAERTMAVLSEYKALLSDRAPSAWLFPSENPRTPIDYANVFRRRIRPALMAAGLGWTNFQAMRRTNVSKSREGGVDPATGAAMLGHGIRVHEEDYRQISIEEKRRAKKAVEETLQ